MEAKMAKRKIPNPITGLSEREGRRQRRSEQEKIRKVVRPLEEKNEKEGKTSEKREYEDLPEKKAKVTNFEIDKKTRKKRLRERTVEAIENLREKQKGDIRRAREAHRRAYQKDPDHFGPGRRKKRAEIPEKDPEPRYYPDGIQKLEIPMELFKSIVSFSTADLAVYGWIAKFSDPVRYPDGCYSTNKSLASKLDLSDHTIKKSIKKLKKAELIEEVCISEETIHRFDKKFLSRGHGLRITEDFSRIGRLIPPPEKEISEIPEDMLTQQAISLLKEFQHLLGRLEDEKEKGRLISAAKSIIRFHRKVPKDPYGRVKHRIPYPWALGRLYAEWLERQKWLGNIHPGTIHTRSKTWKMFIKETEQEWGVPLC